MKAGSLEEIIYYFDSQMPLSPENKEEWEAFYTETHRVEITRIIKNIINNPIGHRFMFGGHSGNGKSTELNKLIFEKEIRKRFSIIKFDVKDILNVNDIEIVELLLAICLKVLEFVDSNGIVLDGFYQKEFEKLEGFFRETLKIEDADTRMKQSGMGVEGKISASAKMPLVRLAAGFFAKMSRQHESRKTLRKEYRPKLNELTNLINEILLHIRTSSDRNPCLLIIDGLDRAPFDKAEPLFNNDGQNIAAIEDASILLTVPVSIIHSPSSAIIEGIIGPIETLKNIRLKDINGHEDEKTHMNMTVLKQAVQNRLSDQGLITEDALEMAVNFSGGVFRTLIDFVSEAANNSTVFGGKFIEKKDMEETINRARIKKKRPLNHLLMKILVEIHENKEFLSEMDEKRLQLLHGLFALEYINGGEWYEVNPLLVDAVKDYKKKYKIGGENDS